MNPVIKKLQYKNQERILVVDPPDEFAPMQSAFPCRVDTTIENTYAFILFFVRSRDAADAQAGAVLDVLGPDGYLWLCYPKGSSKKYSPDINRNSAWDVFKPYGFRPVSQVSIDEDWSALRFRRADLVK